MCVKQPSATKVWRVKQVKQVWKATGKLFTTIGHQWRPTGRLLPLGDQWPLTRNTPPKVLLTKQWKPTSRLLLLGRRCPLVRSTALKSDCLPADPQETIAPVTLLKTYDWRSTTAHGRKKGGGRGAGKKKKKRVGGKEEFRKKFFIGTVRFGNDHFGAIIGYGDYVIGDSVISRVYYVEGLRHNLFSIGQFHDSDLKVAFRKHTCFVRDLDGVDLIKGSREQQSGLWRSSSEINLNFGTLNDLARKDLVRGLPRLKFEKDHLCPACQLGKSRKATHKPKTINTITEVLHTLHMYLCGPLRVHSINGKKYILVIVDDYSRFYMVKFMNPDETPSIVTNLLKQAMSCRLNKIVRFVRTDNGTEFVNKDLTDFYESVGITHEKTVPRTPQQNGVVERWNRTLVEAARTMLIFSKAPLFLWAEAVATACYTQNRSLIHTLHNKTPYELVHDKKPDLSFLRIFGALCYPTNDSEDLGKLKAKADIGFFVGYAPAVPPLVIPTGPSVSISLIICLHRIHHQSSSPSSRSVHHGVATDHSFEVNPFVATEHEHLLICSPQPNSEALIYWILTITYSPNQSTPTHEHLRKWTDSHPLDNIIGNPSRPDASIRNTMHRCS
ncbi:retrovirus-related pol polyprotein from transposon TNT 1-94 [Tanacetum coccineum]